MRPDPAIVFWEGNTLRLGPDITLIRCGGHFEGGTVVHWATGAEGRGVLLSGDIIQVVSDRRYVSFMRSIYGAWFDRIVRSEAKRSIELSSARYLKAIESPPREV